MVDAKKQTQEGNAVIRPTKEIKIRVKRKCYLKVNED